MSSSVIKGDFQVPTAINIPFYPHRIASKFLSHNMGQYLLKKTIQRHSDSINVLAFSHDGSLFASGANDGLIIIFRGNGTSGKRLFS
jgi:WD40 repeat protein